MSPKDFDGMGGAVGMTVQIFNQAGLMNECEFCGDLTYSGADPTDAYKLANALFTKKDPLVAYYATRSELTDAIKDAIPDLDEKCHCILVVENDPS